MGVYNLLSVVPVEMDFKDCFASVVESAFCSYILEKFLACLSQEQCQRRQNGVKFGAKEVYLVMV